MGEIELKLQVPPSALARVDREVSLGGERRMRLQAVYFDTADRRLAASGLVLRLRKEGRRWVQTLKRGSAHGLEREEHEVPLVLAAGREPAPDPDLHAGTPAGAALAGLLAGGHDHPALPLIALYRTDVWRRLRVLRARGGAVELALDRGEIRAHGPDGVERCWPICELEVELLRGPPTVVIDVATRWAARHGLWIDTRSKSERGDRLSRGLGPGASPPIPKPVSVPWSKRMSPPQAWRVILSGILAQALPLWSEWAGGNSAPEVVHQLRVCLRRLRSGWRFVEGWPCVGDAGWEARACALFRRLGEVRDRDVLSAGPLREVQEALVRQGVKLPATLAPAEAPPWSDAERTLHGRVFVELLGATLAPADLPDPSSAAPWPSLDRPPGAVPPSGLAQGPEARSLRTLVAARLRDWHRALRKDAARFATADDESRHRTRRRLKRLRYAVEFSAALFPKGRVEAYLERLREAQEELGGYNDLCVAIAHWQPQAEDHPPAWFVLGWLSARQLASLERCSRALERWRKAEPFWD